MKKIKKIGKVCTLNFSVSNPDIKKKSYRMRFIPFIISRTDIQVYQVPDPDINYIPAFYICIISTAFVNCNVFRRLYCRHGALLLRTDDRNLSSEYFVLATSLQPYSYYVWKYINKHLTDSEFVTSVWGTPQCIDIVQQRRIKYILGMEWKMLRGFPAQTIRREFA